MKQACPKVEAHGYGLTSVLAWQLQVVRLSSQDVPTAYAYELEAATIVQPEQVVAAVKRVVGPKVLA